MRQSCYRKEIFAKVCRCLWGTLERSQHLQWLLVLFLRRIYVGLDKAKSRAKNWHDLKLYSSTILLFVSFVTRRSVKSKTSLFLNLYWVKLVKLVLLGETGTAFGLLQEFRSPIFAASVWLDTFPPPDKFISWSARYIACFPSILTFEELISNVATWRARRFLFLRRTKYILSKKKKLSIWNFGNFIDVKVILLAEF